MGTLKTLAGIGLTGYGAANLTYNFNTISAAIAAPASVGAYTAGVLIAGGLGAVALVAGVALLASGNNKAPSPG